MNVIQKNVDDKELLTDVANYIINNFNESQILSLLVNHEEVSKIMLIGLNRFKPKEEEKEDSKKEVKELIEKINNKDEDAIINMKSYYYNKDIADALIKNGFLFKKGYPNFLFKVDAYADASIINDPTIANELSPEYYFETEVAVKVAKVIAERKIVYNRIPLVFYGNQLILRSVIDNNHSLLDEASRLLLEIPIYEDYVLCEESSPRIRSSFNYFEHYVNIDIDNAKYFEGLKIRTQEEMDKLESIYYANKDIINLDEYKVFLLSKKIYEEALKNHLIEEDDELELTQAEISSLIERTEKNKKSL